MADLGEMAREMERVCRALDHAGVHLAAEDQAESARQLGDQVAYSPLRTLVDHAHSSAQRVLRGLRNLDG
jgi:hypothetical protein